VTVAVNVSPADTKTTCRAAWVSMVVAPSRSRRRADGCFPHEHQCGCARREAMPSSGRSLGRLALAIDFANQGSDRPANVDHHSMVR
jgi:hypothetical protein